MVILITGISSGFGLAMARQFASEGHIVYGTVRREVEHLDGVHYLFADVRDEAAVKAAVAAVLSEQGRIDVLINNAGMGVGGAIEFTSPEDVRLQMQSNFMGQVLFSQAVLPAMRAQRSGRIICFSSLAGRMGLPFQGFYCASKFAIEGYAESLQMEVAEFGIKIILVEPGDFSTGFTASRIKNLSAEAASAYPRLQHSVDSFEKEELGGMTPDVMARRVSKIVSCPRPKFRYVVATLVQKLSLPLRVILPDRWFLKVLNSFYS